MEYFDKSMYSSHPTVDKVPMNWTTLLELVELTKMIVKESFFRKCHKTTHRVSLQFH